MSDLFINFMFFMSGVGLSAGVCIIYTAIADYRYFKKQHEKFLWLEARVDKLLEDSKCR